MIELLKMMENLPPSMIFSQGLKFTYVGFRWHLGQSSDRMARGLTLKEVGEQKSHIKASSARWME